MYEATARNLRTAERFLLEPELSGHFGPSVVVVCDISAKGARIKHGQPLEMGQKSALRVAVDGRQQPVALEAVVVWTQRDGGVKDRLLVVDGDDDRDMRFRRLRGGAGSFDGCHGSHLLRKAAKAEEEHAKPSTTAWCVSFS